MPAVYNFLALTGFRRIDNKKKDIEKYLKSGNSLMCVLELIWICLLIPALFILWSISGIFEDTCDVDRLLIDLQHEMSVTRRSFITPKFIFRFLIADKTAVDTWLFGEGLAEKLKSAKEVEKSGKGIFKTSLY